MFGKTKECFICCDISGKSENEKLVDAFAGSNNIIVNYPIISVSSAFECKCNTVYAHNTCLAKLNKCPTCRKNSKPNVFFIPTFFQKTGIIIVMCYVMFCLLFFLVMGYNCDKKIKNKAAFCEHVSAEFCVVLYICFLACLYFIKWFESRWLFDIYRMKPQIVQC